MIAGRPIKPSAMILLYTIAVSNAVLLAGCNNKIPGKPSVIDLWRPPESNLDFHSLYVTNCIACHTNQQGGISPSINLNNSVYLSLITPEKMRSIIADGVHGTAMPAFSEKSGGRLTATQIDVLIRGIYAWKNNHREIRPPSLPMYSAPLGNVKHGATVFSIYCANCHAKEGTMKGRSITSSAYLGLVSNQYLRTVILAGRPEIGQPNWKELSPMSAQDVSDVVAWLASQRAVDK